VIANYSGKCAISGIDIPDLLFASHIIPWAKDEKERLNPENGICFSALYNQAFDKGLIGLNDDYEILISTELKKKDRNDYYKRFFDGLGGRQIRLPAKYLPRKEFLAWHSTFMKINKIILKAEDFQYPSREERIEAVNNYPVFEKLYFPYEDIIQSSLTENKIFREVKKSDNLHRWSVVLQNICKLIYTS